MSGKYEALRRGREVGHSVGYTSRKRKSRTRNPNMLRGMQQIKEFMGAGEKKIRDMWMNCHFPMLKDNHGQWWSNKQMIYQWLIVMSLKQSDWFKRHMLVKAAQAQGDKDYREWQNFWLEKGVAPTTRLSTRFLDKRLLSSKRKLRV